MVSKDNKRKNKKTGQTPQPTKKAKRTEANTPVEPFHPEQGLTVVGIGASAGGLKALQAFFEELPSDTGLAFVVITHLHPEHESHLAQLLQPHTTMQTSQVTERVAVEPNHIYVIPPNRRILMADSQVDVAEFDEPRGQRTPVDHFFRSLAHAHPKAVAIILSGGGTDGAVGVKAIKEEGGLLMVQHPGEAEYDSMPRAAISTGLVDVVLGVRSLAKKLVEFAKSPVELPNQPDELSAQDQETLHLILSQVHAHTGHDFNQYKHTTLLRRIQRRMKLNGYTTLDSYLRYVQSNATEASSIFNDILIGVTNFFRDRESWEALERKVVPVLFDGKGEGEPVRVWSIGCSTGEEAYSLAMLLIEHASRLQTHHPIQIFASDIDEGSLQLGRQGTYPSAIEADVSPERLARFFTSQGNHYQVKRELRDMVLFTGHSVLRDPPFSRLDLISCRNLLIYLQRVMQDRVFEIFHYALNSGGFVFLGSAESSEGAYELFETIDKTHHIYAPKPRRGEFAHVPHLSPMVGRRPGPLTEATPRPAIRRIHEIPVLAKQHQAALEIYGPPSILVNQEYSILHISETAGRYLLQPGGAITSDLLKLVRAELQFEVRTALFRAFERDKAVVSPPIRVQFNGTPHRVVVSVCPRTQMTPAGDQREKLALVLFLEDELSELPPEEEASEGGDQARSDAMVAQLQMEVQHLREQLQSTNEEFDSSNEEMKAANEELQSINEEFRSATEELETSKEELQSVNEELQTVNNEMKTKLEEISRANNDLENLMSATEIATLFLDRELQIQRFTQGMSSVFNLMDSDRGRPVSHLTSKLAYGQLVEDAQKALRQLTMVEREVQGNNGEWFLVRHRPYRTLDDRIEGVVTTFVNISEVKKVQNALEALNETLEDRVSARSHDLEQANQEVSLARDLFYKLFNVNPIPTALISLESQTFLNVNVEFLKYFGLKPEEIIDRDAHDFNYFLELEASRRAEWLNQLQRDGQVQNYETKITHPSGDTRNILTSIQFIKLDSVEALIAAFIDITDRVRAEQKIRSLASELTGTEQAERHRLSQILHDDLQQRLFAVQMHMSFLRDAYEKNDLQAFRADFPQLEEWLSEAIKVTRQLSVDLSPPILHGEGLLETVIWLAAQMKEQYGLKVDIKANGMIGEIDEKVRVLVFYSVRELLFNIVKHSGTLDAAVRFETVASHLLVIVKDSGVGFDSTQVMNDPQLAHGLLVLRDRLNLLGCTLDLASKPGKGTEAIIEIPYESSGNSG